MINHSSHVCNTWLLAQLLNPIFFFVSFLLTGEPIAPADLVCLSVLSAAFSSPALLTELGFFSMLLDTNGKDRIKFFAWLLVSALSILANMLLLFLLFGKGLIGQYSLQLCLPAVAAAWLAAVIRYPLFIRQIREREML